MEELLEMDFGKWGSKASSGLGGSGQRRQAQQRSSL